jgi:hypothetical protein
MRRLLALAALAAATAVSGPVMSAPAHASYDCLPEEDPRNGVCVQLGECGEQCYPAPGVEFRCYLGFRGETVCRVVRALSVEVGGA